MIEHIPCVILSGGKSSRMGEDKSLLPFGASKTLIEFQHDKLSKIFKNIYISSKSDKFDFPCKIIYDTSEIYSPMVALHSIFQFLDDEKIFIISVDTPLLEENTIHKLIEKSSDKNFDVTVCQDNDKIHNLIGIFDKTILGKMSEMLKGNDHKINTLLTQKMKLQIILFDDNKQFSNINTKEDYLNFSLLTK
jgi:molybdopterin-guanine dinucleotide biosynthesis protein A